MLIQCDAAAIEWRVALELSQDQVGIDELLEALAIPDPEERKKNDTHSRNQRYFELPSRVIAKRYLFRTIYRGSGYAFAHDPEYMHVSTSVKFWDDINRKFYEKYYGLDNWHHWLAREVAERRTVVSPFGREWDFGMKRNFRGEEELPWTVFTNYPVQGTAADIMAIARVSFSNRLKKLGWPVLLVSTVHDSIVVDAPEEYLQRVVDLFHEVFNDLIPNIKKLFGYTWGVPLHCECKAGPNMADMKEVLPSV